MRKDGSVKQVYKYKRRKRFGKSLNDRAPASFVVLLSRKAALYGGNVYKVDTRSFKASQYDHTSDSYIKKELSQRMYSLSDGTVVQRDWYSSYLLYSINTANMTIDKSKCVNGFSDKYAKECALISWIIENKIRVLNSGIRF